MAGEKKFVMGDLCRILVSYFSCSFGVSVSSIYTKSQVSRLCIGMCSLSLSDLKIC